MKLISIPESQYEDYRLNLMFDCYKWDPQFFDSNTIAKYVLVLNYEEYEQLKNLTEKLDKETRTAEYFLNDNLKLTKQLNLPRKISKELESMRNYKPDSHIRLMRYDFHPTIEGKWVVSEVNSDVPGGYAESSLMPQAALDVLKGDSSFSDNYWYINFGNRLVDAILEKVPESGRVMLVHCTCYSDDRQVMQFLGDRLKGKGYQVIYGAADHVNFKDNKAYSILDGNEGELDAIIRFTPIEWLIDIKPRRWQGYFNTNTVSCNHPVAIYAQTKRFPFVWDILEENGIDMSTWRSLLPKTMEVNELRNVALDERKNYIFKPANGRVGEKITIEEACKGNEYKRIMWDVRFHPRKYIAQKKFISKALVGENGQEFHVCLGSYAINGEHAGFYARVSNSPRIDSYAADIPVLIEGVRNDDN